MHEYYYIDAAGSQSGPVSTHILLAMRLPETTLVWREGMPTWTELRNVPELQQAVPPAMPNPQPEQPAYASQGTNPYAYNSASAQASQPVEEPYYNKPETYLIWGILCTVFCCMPFGIVSIIQASKVDSLWNSRQYQASRQASEKAKKWAIWGAALGLLFSVLYVIFVLFGLSTADKPYWP